MRLFDTMRAFVALNVEVEAIRRLAEAGSKLKGTAGAEALRFCPATKLHVTLKFLGDLDSALAPVVRDELGKLAEERAPLKLTFDGLASFPEAHQARVLYAKLEERSDEVTSLASAVDEALSTLGFAREARPFVPHLTLARTREPVDLTTWLATAPPLRIVASARELVFYRSDLARPGAEYDVLGRFTLAARRIGKRAG